MALVSPGVSISINDQSQFVSSNVGSVPLVVLATAQDKTFNNALATGTSKANAGKLQAFTSQRDLVTAMGTPTFQKSSAGTPINASELNEYGLLTAYSALGLGNRLFAIRADVDLNELVGTSNRPVGNVADGTYWLDLANTEFGIYGLVNGVSSTFNHISPLLITDTAQVTDVSTIPTPLASIGQQGSYALVFVDTVETNNAPVPVSTVRLFYKATAVNSASITNQWVQVGSTAWQNSTPVVQGLVPPVTAVVPTSASFKVNGVTVNTSSIDSSLGGLASAINTAAVPGVTALSVPGIGLALFATSAANSNAGTLVITNDTSSVFAAVGITVGTYHAPILSYGTFAQEPSAGWSAYPAGTIWWKTTATGTGYSPVLKQFSKALDTWVSVSAPMFGFATDAIFALDPIGGGVNIADNAVVTFTGVADTTSNNLKFGMNIPGDTVTVGTAGTATAFSGTGTFTIKASAPGQVPGALGDPGGTLYTINLSGSYGASGFVTAILAANIPFVTAQVNTDGTVSIIHTANGQIVLNQVSGTNLHDAGFVTGQGTGFTVQANGFIIVTDWNIITTKIVFSATTPVAAPMDGTLWYYSNPTDIDVMINDVGGWKGYQKVSADVRGYKLGLTDPMGVIISASMPTSQSDGTVLVAGDLWLDSSDLVNFPSLYRCTAVTNSIPTWTPINNEDHVSNNGIVFADARWDGVANSTTGNTTDPAADAFPAITTLLTSNHIDLDAPDYRLYPRGTLLFNTRRSGFNIKKFVSNYFSPENFPNAGSWPTGVHANAWVSVSGLKENGTMYAGTAAQRNIVVSAMKAAVDSNTDVLDSNFNFNLLVAPGYPELIPNLVTLNENRSNTGFIIGDTPMTMAANITDITTWESNANGNGLATASPYLAVYYPAGLTNDVAGNTVAVPASHAVLRTYLYNDQVAFPWFAPAGVNRGLVSNLSDIGYVDANSGAFIHNGINQGLRDGLSSININPVTQLPGTGLVVWGQETRSGSTTSRNRVNVVRLENYLRTIFATISNGFLFEPNDTITRKSLASQIESALHDLLSKRGLYDFLVICDTSNNTPSTIANNQLFVDVAIEPMRDVEFIYIPIALYNPGTVAQLGASST
jgi:hypothetical protein